MPCLKTWERIPQLLFRCLGVPDIAIVGFDMFARMKVMPQDLGKNLDVSGVLIRRIGSLYPHQIPGEDVHPQFVPESGLPGVFVGFKYVPFLCFHIWGDLKVRPVYGHNQAPIVSHGMDEMALEVNLWKGGVQ